MSFIGYLLLTSRQLLSGPLHALFVAFVCFTGLASPLRSPAQWARPVRFDPSGEASIAWQSATAHLQAGRVSEAAEGFASLLNRAPYALIEVEGRGVSIETAVSTLLRQQSGNGLQLAEAISVRLDDREQTFRWYDKQAVAQRQSQHAIFVDAGFTDRSAAVAEDTRLFGLDKTISNETPETTAVSSLNDRVAEPGWAVDFQGDLALPDDLDYGVLREWGLEPLLASSPVEADGKVLVRHPFGVCCYESTSSRELWSHRFGAALVTPTSAAYWIRHSVTATIFGTPSVHGQKVAYIAPGKGTLRGQAAFGGASPEQLGSATTLPGIECLSLSTGQLLWQKNLGAIPLAAPIELNGMWWLPARSDLDLLLVALDLDTGDLVHKVTVAELPDGGRGRPVPMYAAAIQPAGLRVVAAFDEGAVVCFDTSTKLLEWVRPIGTNATDSQVLEIRPEADPAGGAAGFLPRGSHGEAQIVLSRANRTVLASCPGWSAAVHLSLLDGSNAAAPFERELPLIEEHFNRVVVHTAPADRVISLGRQRQLSRTLIKPTPHSVSVGDSVWLQTDRVLRRIGPESLEVPRLAPELTWATLTLPIAASFIAQPVEFLRAEFLRDEPLWFDDGHFPKAISIPWPGFSETLTADRTVASNASKGQQPWGNAVTLKSEQANTGMIGTTPWFPVPLQRLTENGPHGVNISVDALQRVFLRVRMNGRSVGQLRLPGPNGDERRDGELTRAWQIDSTVVVQLGRELFGIHLEESADGKWDAEVAWPRLQGLRLSPPRSRLVSPSYEPVETVVGTAVVDSTGRLAGNVAVTCDRIAISQANCYVTLDPHSGRLDRWRNDRKPYDVLTTDGKKIWVVDSISGSAKELTFDDRAPKQLPDCSSPLLAVNDIGRWCYDSRLKRLSVYRWGSGDAVEWRCDDSDLVHVDRRRTVFVADSEVDNLKQVFVIDSEGREFHSPLSPEIDVSHVFAVDSQDGCVVGLSRAVKTPGLLNLAQPRNAERHIVDGQLIALVPDEAAKFRVLWSIETEPCGILDAQPSDAPILYATWNEKPLGPDGKLDTLPATTVLIRDSRSGTVLLQDQAKPPITPSLDVDAETQTVTVRIGRAVHSLSFHGK